MRFPLLPGEVEQASQFTGEGVCALRISHLKIYVFFLFFLTSGCGGQGFAPVPQPAVPQGQAAVGEKVSSQPFFEGERTIPLQTYELPTLVEERIEEEVEEQATPDVRESYKLSKAAKKLALEGLGFTVDIDQKKMRFRGRLKSQDQVLEEILLEGNFDPAASLWSSNDLFPVDGRVRAEKRMQATAVCLDTNVCDRVAVRFYIQYEGELLELHFERDAVSVSEANSGHFDDLEDVLEDAEPDSSEEVKTEEEDSLFSEPRYKESAVIEYNGPTQTPAPKVTENSVAGIEKYSAPESSSRPQAIGRHNNGRLQYATALPLDGPGFTRRGRSSSHNTYGADLMVSLIQQAAKATEAAYPGRPPFSVGDLSAKTGRKLKRHASHQHGLDADIAFPRKTSKDRAFWTAVNRDGSLSSKLDKERFWKFSKALVCSKSSGKSHVMVIFIDQKIKRQMCAYAKSLEEDLTNRSSCAYQALRSMKHWPGHANHIHVRAYCPGTTGCANAEVSLPNSTGC